MKRIPEALEIVLIFWLMAGSLFAQQYNESNDFSYALKLYNEHFYDVAAKQFASFINRYPGSERLPDARYYYAESLYHMNEIEDARIEFQSLAVSYPDHPRAAEAWQKVGECYRKLNKLEEAAKAYETIKILYPENPLAPQALLDAAACYINVDQFAKAEQVLRDFLDRYPEYSGYPRGHILYGNLLLKKGELERADTQFRKALTIGEDPQVKAEAQLGLAAVFQQLGLRNRAVETLTAVAGAQGGTEVGFRAVERLAQIRLEGREWEAALQFIREQYRRYPAREQQNRLKLLEAQALFLKGDFFPARQLLTELSGAVGDEALARRAKFYLACCDYEEGKTEAAMAGFSRLEPALQKANPDPGFLPVVVHNLADLYLKTGQLSRAREYVRKFQARYPDDPAGETLHRRLIEEFFAAGQLATGVDELQRFMGAYPDSPYRDDLLFAAGKAFFRHRNYQRSLLYFEQVTGEYFCSAVYDSSRAYADFIHTYHSPTRQTGVEELARLIGKIILGEDRRQLMYELGQVYLRDLQAFEEAAAIFRKYLEAARDSTEVGEGAYYLAESYLRLAEYQQFRNPRQAAPYREQAMQALKTAMTHVRHVPHPDTLTYRFLSLQLPPESTPPEKLVQFWQRFEQAYPESPLLPAARWRLAKGYLAAGDTVQALAYLELLIGDAGNPLYRGYAYWEKAQLSAARGNLDIAIQTLKDFLLETPNHPYQARAYRQLAEYHTALGDFATAAQFLERLQQLFNYADEAGDAPLLIADNYIRAGEFGKAFEVISPFLSREELATDPIARRYLYAPPAAFHFYAGKAHYLRDEFRPARRHLMAYLNQEPQGAFQGESLLLLGKMAQEEGDYDSALLHFSLISQDAGEEIFYQATAIAADILFDQEKYTEALEKYDILIPLSKDPDQKIANEVQKLRCLIHLGRQSAYQTQLKAFEATYKKHPRKAQYLALLELERGKYAYGQKNFDRAIRHFKRVRSKFKNTDYADDAQYYLGRCYATLNRTEEAMKELTRFLKDFPNSNLLGNGYLTLAEIYFRAEKGVEGLEAVKKAVEVAADPATKRSALALLIRTYRDNGLWDAALQATREYLQQFPHAPDAVSHKISLGIFLTRLNRYTEAIDYLQRLKYEVSSEDEPEIQYYIGEAYYNAGQYEQAINEFLKIPLLSRKTKLQWEASAFYMAGQSYEKLGRISDAVRMYQEIIERPGIRIEFKREARRLIERLKQ